MERQFFSGNTLEQAILAAARHHGLEPDRVAYKPRDKKHGFVNIRRRVVIEVDPAAPEKGEQVAEDEPVKIVEARVDEPHAHPRHSDGADEGTRPSRQHQSQTHQSVWRGKDTSWVGSQGNDEIEAVEIEAVERAVKELGELVGIDLASSIRQEEKGFDIELTSPDSDLLRENQGGGLDAIEHLLPRLVRGLSGRGVPCRVDSEGFRAAREEELRGLARSAAADVCREQEEKRLEPMTPADRRQVHMALVDDPKVRTESEGEGFLKRVRILPS